MGSTLMMGNGYGVLCEQDSSLAVPMERYVSDCTLARNSYMNAGDKNNAARTLNDFAGVYFQRGELNKAETMWREAIEVFREVGDAQGFAASSNNVGEVLLARGKFAESQKLLEQAISGYESAGDQSGIALARVDLGDVALQKANLTNAKMSYDQAVTIGNRIGDKSVIAYGLEGLGDVFMQRDQLADARSKYQAAFKLRTELGETENSLLSRVALARLSIEEGHAADIENEIRSCQGEFHKAQMFDDELNAGMVLAHSLLAQSKTIDARRVMTDLRPLESKTENREFSLRFSLQLGLILKAEHDISSAHTLIKIVSKTAETSGSNAVAWEARLALAELQFDSGDIAGASSQLKSIETSEQNAGLFLLARKTVAVQRRVSGAGDQPHKSQ
jgi:tetratricopeptide (TPR) repeat protein